MAKIKYKLNRTEQGYILLLNIFSKERIPFPKYSKWVTSMFIILSCVFYSSETPNSFLEDHFEYFTRENLDIIKKISQNDLFIHIYT